jgi:signal transduction histidine kinase
VLQANLYGYRQEDKGRPLQSAWSFVRSKDGFNLMADEDRQSGIAPVGAMKWGTHFCHFYETQQDLLDILIPFFQTGLEGNELCIWVVFDPLNEEQALLALLQAFPGAARHLSAGAIEIIPHSKWYLVDGGFDPQRVIAGWKEKLSQALASGYAGMRVNGSEAWLTDRDRQHFAHYEEQLDEMIAGERMIVLCTYPLAVSRGSEVFEVARNHQFAIAKRDGEWEVIESAQLKQAKEELQAFSQELEARVVDRTRALGEANARLRRASARLESARDDEGNRISREIHDQLGSALTGLRWGLDDLQRSILDIPEPAMVTALREKISTLQLVTDSAIHTVRRVASEICPSILHDLGLTDAVEWQASDFQRRTGIECQVESFAESVRLSAEQSMAVYRILQEALTNILRHASATRVSISIEPADDNFTLNIRDNGKGIPENKVNSGSLGIWSMGERARLAGGTFSINGMEGNGTTVTVQIPGKVHETSADRR